ncbi:MAG: ABC transporter substrate-binding protein [Alphaproteobacteria bacterium]|nr:ABC transporter substrate-binding protein [Alphaproteobacteria bacterium]
MRLIAVTRSVLLAAALLAGTGLAASAQVTKSHGLAMHGDLKYGPGFKHFDYANPDAPKGGEVKLEAFGTYDNFNAWILGGSPAGVVGSTLDTMMVASADEPFSKYCLICETIEIPADRGWIAFNINPAARFHDGSPITPEDVVWTFETLMAKGHPFFRSYYSDVAKIEKTGERQVRYSFKTNTNRELALIVAELPVMSRKWWESRDFTKPLLEPPLGSGPYRIENFEMGRFVRLVRVADYWGRDLPVRRGQFNFDAMRYDWYRDRTVALEAFKAGEFDIRVENQALAWATRYDSPARERGLYKLEEIPEERTSGMQGFVYNMRRPVFQDVRVREALTYAFDYEWSNRQLFFGAYARTRSYFDNSELAARGLPSAEELKLLEPLRASLPERVFTEAYEPPKTDGSGTLRDNLRIATRMLREAGWQVKDNKLTDPQGRQFKFEILINSGSQFERIILPFVENLKRLGVDASIRSVDVAQFQRRVEAFDYDMIVTTYGQSESPGNEQRDYWMSEKADVPGSRNTAGLKNPAVDKLVEQLINAPDRASLVTVTRALDRVLQWSFLVVPHWHSKVDRVAMWDRFGRPAITPKQGYIQSVLWVDPAKDASLRERRAQQR